MNYYFQYYDVALNKKFAEKLRKEWDDRLKRKEEELETEKREELSKVSVMFKQ